MTPRVKDEVVTPPTKSFPSSVINVSWIKEFLNRDCFYIEGNLTLLVPSPIKKKKFCLQSENSGPDLTLLH